MNTATLLPEVDQPRPSGVWDYISPSRLNLWLRCPLAWKARYIDKIRTPTTAALFVGTRVHDGLEVYYRHRQLGIALDTDAVVQRVTDSWDAAVAAETIDFKSADESHQLRDQAAALVKMYLDTVDTQEPKPLAVETSLEIPLVDPDTGQDLGIPLLGVVDLILEDDHGPLVIDFKTAAKSAAPFEITHEVQLSSYAYLFRHATAREEGGLEIRSLIKTKTPKIEFHHYGARTAAHFRRLFSVIRAYLDDLNAGRCTFRPGFGCATCDYRDGPCRTWSG
jgi:RecB family exonuclease